MSDLADFRLTGDQIWDLTMLIELIDVTFLEARFDPEGDDPGIIHQETLELIHEAARQRLEHLHKEKEPIKLWFTDICNFEVDGKLVGIVRLFSDGTWGAKLLTINSWSFSVSRQDAMKVVELAWKARADE